MPQLVPLLHSPRAPICMPIACSIPRPIPQLPYKTPPMRKRCYPTPRHYIALQLMLLVASRPIRLRSRLSMVVILHLRTATTLQSLHCFYLAQTKAMSYITRLNPTIPIITCRSKIASSTGIPKDLAFPFSLLKSHNRLLTSPATFPSGRVYPSIISTALLMVIARDI